MTNEAGSTVLVPTNTPETPRLCRVSHLKDRWVKQMQMLENARLNGKPLAPVTGIGKVDAVLGCGLQPGLHILTGGPGVGKSALALQIAASCGFPALYLSCEQSGLELVTRLVARHSGEFAGKFASGQVSASNASGWLDAAAAASPDLALLDSMGKPVGVEDLKAMTEVMKGERESALLVVDSLHAWTESDDSAGTEYERLNNAVLKLQWIVSELCVPILVIVERNRQSMEKGGLHASAGTRRIEYCGETVMSLDRAEDKPPGSVGSCVDVTLAWEKNRHGAAGASVLLHFHGALMKFTD